MPIDEPVVQSVTSDAPQPFSTPSTRVAKHVHVQRVYARDTWKWVGKDTAGRVLPFVGVTAAYVMRSGVSWRELGVRADHWRREILLGIVAGLPMAGLAAWYRGRVSPRYGLPTRADQALQTTFYFVVNAPGEELFWRGLCQGWLTRRLTRAFGSSRAGWIAGWGLVTVVFGVYHRLGGFGWSTIAGMTVAGALFGALYDLRPGGRSFLLPTIVHGFATAGYLSWGDAFLYWRATRRAVGATPPPAGETVTSV